jgi:hypothetical protein
MYAIIYLKPIVLPFSVVQSAMIRVHYDRRKVMSLRSTHKAPPTFSVTPKAFQ